MKVTFRLAFLLFVVAAVASAQKAPSRPDTTFPRFTVTEGQLDEDGFPTSGAKLCLTAEKGVCYQMPSYQPQGSDQVKYDFGLEPHAKVLPRSGGGSWVFFSAMFSAGGSGTLTRLAMLQYQNVESNSKALINLLPLVCLTNVSEHAIWRIQSISPDPVLVDANFIWSRGETHFSRHFFTVTAWRFDKASDRYVKALSYRTSRKYEGGDSGPVSVLGPERGEILRRLSTR